MRHDSNNRPFNETGWWAFGFWSLVAGGIAGAVMVVNMLTVNDSDEDRNREKTEQVRIEACKSIEDEGLRMACVLGIDT